MQSLWRSFPRQTSRFGRHPALPSATVCLLAASLAGIALWYAARLPGEGAEQTLRQWAGLTADGLYEGRLWEPITHLFLPGSVTWLLLVELPVLLLAGRHLEGVIGRRHLVALFLLGGVAGGLAQGAVGTLHGAADYPVAGPGPGVLAIFVALACVKPEIDAVPPWSLATESVGWLRLRHGAFLAVLSAAATLVAAEAAVAFLDKNEPRWGLAAARALAGCVVGCIYMRQLGFGRRASRSPEEEAAWAAAALDEDEEAAEPVFAAPVAAAAGRLVVPRFTEVDRRMSARQYISQRIDPILDKITLHGIGSLTDEERRTLENARQKMARGK